MDNSNAQADSVDMNSAPNGPNPRAAQLNERTVEELIDEKIAPLFLR